MLDYEIKWYTVYYVKSFYGKVTSRHKKFLSEDEAIEFIKKHRSEMADAVEQGYLESTATRLSLTGEETAETFRKI
jgi:hypothetical protein